MSRLWFSTQFMQDPVRLTLPAGPNNIIDIGDPVSHPFASITVGANGNLQVGTSASGTTNYNNPGKAWWGYIGTYTTPGPGNQSFPGHMWEVRASLISGAFSTMSGTFGSFVRLIGNASFLVQNDAGGTQTGVIRLTFRRFGTTVTLGTTDIDISLTF